MPATPVLHTLGNGDMAFQAFAIAQLSARFVTGKTLGQAFELGVRLREWAGRNLRGELAAKHAQEQKARTEVAWPEAASAHAFRGMSLQHKNLRRKRNAGYSMLSSMGRLKERFMRKRHAR